LYYIIRVVLPIGKKIVSVITQNSVKNVSEFIKEFTKELNMKPGADPSTAYRVRSNMTSRKFGYNPLYRHVDDAVCGMLLMTEEERNTWMETFWSEV